jgi:hypothetical protein
MNSPLALETKSTIGRDSGKRKVVFRAPIDPQRRSVDPNAPLLDYHDVFAVDTNTREFGGTRISIACVVHLAREQGSKGLLLRPEPVAAVELHNVRGTPADVERVVWRLVCEQATADPNFRPGRRIRLVAHSERAGRERIRRPA